MAFIPVPNTCRAELIFTSLGQVVENVFHIEKDDPWTLAELASMGAALVAWWKAELRDLTPSTVVLDRCDLRDLTTEAAAFASVPCESNCGGNGGNQQLPNNVTAAIKWTTGLTGRSQRGRTYHIGLAEDHVTGDTISGAVVSALLSAYSALLDAVINANPDARLVVVSYVHEGEPRTTGQTTTITTATVNNIVDSQRRRLTGRGA